MLLKNSLCKKKALGIQPQKDPLSPPAELLLIYMTQIHTSRIPLTFYKQMSQPWQLMLKMIHQVKNIVVSKIYVIYLQPESY